MFPGWKNFRLVEGEKEVAPGVRLVSAPGHTPGHAAFHVSSGNQQLMISNDTAYVPALLGPHPEWQGAYDQDGPLAVESRRKLIDRVIAEKMMVCGRTSRSRAPARSPRTAAATCSPQARA